MARRAKKIDNLIWVYSSGESLAQSAGVVGRAFASVGTTPTTLLRMRGEWYASISSAKATGIGCRITLGIIKVPEGSGATVRYSPISDANAPWIWYSTAHLQYEEAVTDVVANPPGAFQTR